MLEVKYSIGDLVRCHVANVPCVSIGLKQNNIYIVLSFQENSKVIVGDPLTLRALDCVYYCERFEPIYD